MAFDKVVDSGQLNSWITDIGDSVRKKTGKQEKIPIQNIAAEIDGISGGGESFTPYITNYKGLFKDAKVPADYKLVINNKYPDWDGDLSYFCNNVKNLKEIVFNSESIQKNKITFDYSFNGCEKLQRIDLSGIKFPSGNIELSKKQGIYWMYLDNELLEIIGTLDMSEVPVHWSHFAQAVKLKEIRFAKNSIKRMIRFDANGNLSPESIQSIIDGLATVAEPQTLTLHPDVKAKLTAEQTQTITAKNWILA